MVSILDILDYNTTRFYKLIKPEIDHIFEKPVQNNKIMEVFGIKMKYTKGKVLKKNRLPVSFMITTGSTNSWLQFNFYYGNPVVRRVGKIEIDCGAEICTFKWWDGRKFIFVSTLRKVFYGY